jgi:hypothetical protein
MYRPVEICEKTEDASKNWEMERPQRERERERERESSIKQNAFQISRE